MTPEQKLADNAQRRLNSIRFTALARIGLNPDDIEIVVENALNMAYEAGIEYQKQIEKSI